MVVMVEIQAETIKQLWQNQGKQKLPVRLDFSLLPCSVNSSHLFFCHPWVYSSEALLTFWSVQAPNHAQEYLGIAGHLRAIITS